MLQLFDFGKKLLLVSDISLQLDSYLLFFLFGQYFLFLWFLALFGTFVFWCLMLHLLHFGKKILLVVDFSFQLNILIFIFLFGLCFCFLWFLALFGTFFFTWRWQLWRLSCRDHWHRLRVLKHDIGWTFWNITRDYWDWFLHLSGNWSWRLNFSGNRNWLLIFKTFLDIIYNFTSRKIIDVAVCSALDFFPLSQFL